MSYNIQVGIECRRYRQYVTGAWRHFLPCEKRQGNLNRIADLVRGYDLVGIQEADGGSYRSGFVNQVEYLADRAGFPWWHHQVNRKIGTIARHSLGLLSRLPMAEVIEHRLPGAIPGRGALSVRLGEGRQTLLVVIVHLALGKPTRARQIDHLGELLRDEKHVILLGDMNFRSESAEMRRLVSLTGLREPAHGLLTHPSWRPVRNIDHILVSPTLKVRSVEVPDHRISDHLPIAASIGLPRVLRLPPTAPPLPDLPEG